MAAKQRKRMIDIFFKLLPSVIMFCFFILVSAAIYIVDKTGMTISIMFRISVGLVTMLGLSILYLVHSMDTTPDDVSSHLFSGMIVTAYLGTICDNITWSITWLIDFNTQRMLFLATSYSLDLGSFLVMPIMLALFWNYQRRVFVGKSKMNTYMKTVVNTLAAADILFIIIGTGTKLIFYINDDGKYKEGSGAALTFIYPALVVLLCVIDIIRQRLPLKKKLSLLSVGLLPAVTIITSILLPDYNFVYALSFMNLFLLYGTVQSQKGYELAEHDKKIAEQERELIVQQTQIMISQIQPHFLYNTLTAIYHLCDMDTELAQKTIRDFSEYLRGNMDGIKSTAPIAFEKELAHTKTYLAIESLRFGDILGIEYDIRITDFEIPALTLQPLVENAVKHGIRSREDGGTVTITTKRENGKIFIIVHDDGMGFDPQKSENDGKTHIGIANTRERLKIMINADLIVSSEVGVGTTATIVMEDKK